MRIPPTYSCYYYSIISLLSNTYKKSKMTLSVHNYLIHSPISMITLKSIDFVTEISFQKSAVGGVPTAGYTFDLKVNIGNNACKLESNEIKEMAEMTRLLTP